MENGRANHSKSIWLVGRPRFLREALGKVLTEKFASVQIREFSDAEPPALALDSSLTWLVWFLNAPETVVSARQKIDAHPPLNVLMIQNNGHAFARWDNRDERHLDDISLTQVISILGASLNPNKWAKGETHVTHSK